jgi:hypothetical protein
MMIIIMMITMGLPLVWHHSIWLQMTGTPRMTVREMMLMTVMMTMMIIMMIMMTMMNHLCPL